MYVSSPLALFLVTCVSWVIPRHSLLSKVPAYLLRLGLLQVGTPSPWLLPPFSALSSSASLSYSQSDAVPSTPLPPPHLPSAETGDVPATTHTHAHRHAHRHAHTCDAALVQEVSALYSERGLDFSPLHTAGRLLWDLVHEPEVRQLMDLLRDYGECVGMREYE